MNVAVPASGETSVVDRRSVRQTFVEQAGIALSAFAIILAAAVVVYGAGLAINWYNLPYLGATINQSGVVLGSRSLVGAEWPALSAGLQADDRLVSIDGVAFDAAEAAANAGPLLNQVLAARSVGQAVQVVVFRPAIRIAPDSRGECRPVEGGAECTYTVTLGRKPLLDFLGYFGIGLVTALIAIGLGVWLWLTRRQQAVARTIIVLCAAGAFIFVGRFEIVSTFQMFVLVLMGMVVLGGMMLQLGMLFPYPLAVVRRAPWLRFAAILGTAGVFIACLFIYTQRTPNAFDFAVTLALLYMILAGAFLVVSMVFKRSRSSSAIAREQSAIVLLSVLVPLIPGALWLITNVIERTQGLQGISFSTVYLQPPMLLVPFGLTYALLQQRFFDTDRLIGNAIVLAMLGGMLVIGYLAITGAAFALTAGAIRADNPLVIALMLFVIAVLFTPVRVRMEQLVEDAFFHQRRLYERRLEQFSRSLTTAIDVGDVVSLLQEELDQTLAPQYVFVFLRNLTSGDYEAVLDPATGRPQTDIRFKADRGLIQYLERAQNIIYLEREGISPAELQSDRPRLAVLNTPVIARLHSVRRLNGFVALGPRRDHAEYTHEDLRFLEGLASQAAAAFERAQVVLEAQQNERELQVLVQVSQALNIAMDFDMLLEFIYAQVDKVISAPNFFIALRDLKSDELYYAFYQEARERIPEKEGQRWPLGRDLMSEIVRTQQPYRTDNYVRDMQRRDSANRIENNNLRAWVGVPLNATEGRTIGCLVIATTDPNVVYTDDQTRIFWNIADLAATAIYKIRLLSETSELARQMQVLNETSSRLATLFEDVDALLQSITESAIEILNCEAGSLLLVDEDSGDLVFEVVIGGGGESLVGTRIPAGSGIVGTVVASRQPVIVNNPRQDPRWYGEVIESSNGQGGFQTDSILAVPLAARGKVIGVLEVINKRDRTGFDEPNVNLLMTFAGQAAVAIENANLFRQTDEALAERVKQLFNMQRIDQELNRTLDLQRVVDLTVDNALRESEADAGALALISDDPPGFRIVGSAGYPERILKTGDFFDIGYGVLGRVYRESQPLLILNPTAQHTEILPDAQNQLAVPLVTGEKVTGVLVLESLNSDTFTPMTAEHIQGLAEHANTAITNAQLFDRLAEANHARINFVGIVAHELKNPIASIKGYSEVMMGGRVGPLNERQQEFLAVIRRNVVRMQQLIEDLRDLTAQETGNLRLTLQKVNFHAIVLDSVRPQQRSFDEKNQTITLNVPEELPPVWADEGRLIQIMTNFLSNANKYTPEGGTITITAEKSANIWDPDGAPEVIHCTVQDTGIGMTEDDLKQLFTAYWRSSDPRAREQTGTGLGMSLTRGLIEAHGGKIWVESTLNVGTTFHFTMPLAIESLEAERAGHG